MNLNVFETMQLLDCSGFRVGNQSLLINGVYIPGSIPFHTPWVLLSNSNGGTATHTVSLGLYTLTGSTLTLVNSGSGTQVLNGNVGSWVSLITSVASTLTPGAYYFAVELSLSAGAPQIYAAAGAQTATGVVRWGGYGGVFVRGCLSVSTTALPVSIATSDCLKEGASTVAASTVIPYVLISA